MAKEDVAKQMKEYKELLNKYNAANHIRKSSKSGICFVCSEPYPPGTMVHFRKEGEAHHDCYEYNLKRGLPLSHKKSKHQKCADCKMDVYGPLLTYFDSQPVHTRCLENYKKIKELFG